MDSYFIKYIKTIANIPKEQEDKFCSFISLINIKSKQNFITEGEVPKTIAFVRSGLFRYYYINNNGMEFTKGFFLENTVLSSYSAILKKRSSYFTIQALEDSIIEIIDYVDFLKLYTEHPSWKDFLVIQLQKAFMMKEEREFEFLVFNAKQRYNSFLQRFPNLENRVKQHIIASYLRIAPESLSRIRREIGLLT